MKKTNWTLVLVLVVLASFTLSAQKSSDLVGTWEGGRHQTEIKQVKPTRCSILLFRFSLDYNLHYFLLYICIL